MEVGGKYSILVIFGYTDDIESHLIKAARREPINRNYEPHEGKFFLRWEWRTKKAAERARARMWTLYQDDTIPRWVWIGKVQKDEFLGG